MRQGNQFFYLTGVVEPRAIVADRRPHEEDDAVPAAVRTSGARQRMYGPGLSSGGRGGEVRPAIDAVLARDEFAALVTAIARDGRTIYTPFRPEVLGEASSSDPARTGRATKADPWDGRVSREEQFASRS